MKKNRLTLLLCFLFMPFVMALTMFAQLANAAVNLGWTDNSLNESGFILYRSDTPDGQFSEVGRVPSNVKTFIDGSLLPGRSYSWRVTAWNDYGESAPSNTLTYKIPGGIPNAPSTLKKL